MSKRSERRCAAKKCGHPMCVLPLNTEPITASNGAVMAYIALVAAGDMRKEGLDAFGTVLERAAARLARDYGRLPPGTFIPDDVWRVVYGDVVRMVREGAAKAAPTMGEA